MNFKCWIDSIETQRKLKSINTDKVYKYAFVTTVKFKPYQTIKVVNTFNHGFGYSSNPISNEYSIKYILQTSSARKANFDKVKITFLLKKECFNKILTLI